jgi:transposase InsO family protein
VSMSNPADRVEIITSVQRRRRWTASEKVRIVEETFEPGLTVSVVARRHGVAPNHGLLLDRHVGGVERRHDGRIAVDARNRRWCSDGFEIGCDHGERVRVAFALDAVIARP